MLRLQLVLISTVAIAILTTVFAISSSFSIFSSNTKYDDSKRSVGSSGNNDRIKTATINTPHGVYQTSGYG
jgi:hypothetical protein